MALFLGLNQAERLHVEQITLHPVNLFLGHAAALEINGEAGEMGRRSIALSWGRIAIMPAKFFLDLHRAHRGIHLNLFVKAVVVGLRNILHKVAGPGAAIPARRIKARIEAQRFTRDDGLERSTGF